MNSLYKKISVALINSSLPEPYNSYGDHWYDGFVDAGCEVTVIPYDQIEYIPPKFDLYFFVEIRYDLGKIPWYINPRVVYSWDSHITDIHSWNNYSKFFDWILLASKIDTDNLHKMGTKNVAWIPEACNPRVHKNLHQDRSEKLGFVGNFDDHWRRNGFTKNDFIDHFKLYHKTLSFGGLYTIEQNKIKIMFDRTIAHNIGTRLFESCAAGCVPLWSKAGYDNGIDELLSEGIHYLPYDDTIESLEKVLGDLTEERMDKITHLAEKHVLNNHTYAHRALQVLKTVGIKPIKFIT